ncbi:MAG: oxidoreductase [Vulcanimicrobiaceae bacterium]|jgi:NAD(P)-dependent dehydrogenase (short-subunit alcohol dehydrogenase family)
MHSRRGTTHARTWLITGVSRGLGRALAEAALRHGERVLGTTRHPEAHEELRAVGIETLQLDLTDHEGIARAVDEAWQLAGRIDVLVNNAGFGVLGAIEEVEDADLRTGFETNVFGTLAVIRAALPHFRRQRGGYIVNLSSIGGIDGHAGWGISNATKFAVEGLSEALAEELRPFGVRVTIVEPGMFRTGHLGSGSLHTAANVIEDYAATSGRARTAASQFEGREAGDPARAAEAIYAVTRAPETPMRLVLGADAIARVRSKIAALEEDVGSWERVSIETAFPDAAFPDTGIR